MFKLIKKLIGEPRIVYAHCDVPCGIYDPHQAQVAALTAIRMVDIIQENAKLAQEAEKTGSNPFPFRHTVIRAIAVKEEHAEMCKREARIIWGDYFKDEHLQKYPELNDLVHKIMQLGSRTRQNIDREVAIDLLAAVNRFAEIFWESKGVATKKLKAPYKPEEEIIYPVLS